MQTFLKSLNKILTCFLNSIAGHNKGLHEYYIKEYGKIEGEKLYREYLVDYNNVQSLKRF